MSTNRTTYKYHFIVDRKIVHRGLTNDLVKRERDHRRTWPNGKIKQIDGKTTRQAALEWERNGGKA